jgi:Cft2 family RNA processing exonuclease
MQYRFSKYIHPVSMNSSFMVRDVQITFIDANHCPGAAIILFVLKNGQTYLHTGDFRYQPEMLSHPALKMYVSQSSNKCSSVRRLDGIYLDTTYAEPKYSFPPQVHALISSGYEEPLLNCFCIFSIELCCRASFKNHGRAIAYR